ncbi:hypothetical protein C5H24_12320 [Xylella fastidiosa]|nr:hypothetical protein C5H24_12320 [Xylella fastidiosa]
MPSNQSQKASERADPRIILIYVHITMLLSFSIQSIGVAQHIYLSIKTKKNKKKTNFNIGKASIDSAPNFLSVNWA